MEELESGKIILAARKEKGLTQRQVADLLHVSDKTVSKWERGGGTPDIRLMSKLAEVLELDLKTLLSGISFSNEKDSGNMKKIKFYLCQSCGNIVTSTGNAQISCCGKRMKTLEHKKENEDHNIIHEVMDGEYYIQCNHEMSKEHYISFICYVTCNQVNLVKLYPEQNCEVRIPKRGHGILYICCNRDGLFRKYI